VIQRAVVLSEGRSEVTPADGLLDAPEDRRAFWELMRKHSIDARRFRST